MLAGYWQTKYFPDYYFADDYWPHFPGYSGKVTITITTSAGAVSFSAKLPAVGFSGKKPGVGFSGKKPGVSFSGKGPSTGFTGS